MQSRPQDHSLHRIDESFPPASASQMRMDFFDPVALAATVTNAEIDIAQQSPGSFHASLSSIPMPHSELNRGELNQSYLLKGTYPRDIAMFSFWFPGSDPMKIRGENITPDDTLVFGQHGMETEMLTMGGNHFGTFAIDRVKFLGLAKSVYQVSPESWEPRVHILSNCREYLEPLRILIHDIESLVFHSPQTLLDPRRMEEFENRLTLGFMDVLFQCHQTSGLAHPPSREYRRRILHKVDDFLFDHQGEVVKLTDLCHVGGTSKRALQYAFQEAYQMSPMSYLKMRRLNLAHRELLRESPETSTVTDIAYRYGCCHLGRFAIEYKKHFAESPSQALMRSSKSTPK